MKLYKMVGEDVLSGEHHEGLYLASNKKAAMARFDHDAVVSGWTDVEMWWCIKEVEEIPLDKPMVAPVKYGSWFDVGSLSCRCSACGCKNDRETRFCPNCGAKMDGQE